MALKKPLGSDHGDLKGHAVKMAVGFGDDTFMGLALESWLRGLPKIIMEMYVTSDYYGRVYFEVFSVNAIGLLENSNLMNLDFSGKTKKFLLPNKSMVPGY